MTYSRLALPTLCAALLLGLASAPALAEVEEDGPQLGNGVETRLELVAELSETCEAELSREFESEAERREAMQDCLSVDVAVEL